MARISNGYGLDHSYKFYKNKYKKGVSRELYRKICYDLNRMIVEDALEGKVVSLPHSMGSLWIKKYQTDLDNPPIDLNESKKRGKRIYHLNEHSDGYQGRWSWHKYNNAITNKIYYSFTATRANKRAVSKVFKQPGGHKRYFA